MKKPKLSIDWWAVIIVSAIVASIWAFSQIYPYFTFPW